MGSKLKVLFIATANNIHTVKWVNSLSEYFEIHLVYCNGHQETMNKINDNVILHKLKFKPPFGYYLNALQLRKIFNAIKPDVVNTHYASGYGTLTRIARIPLDLLSVWGSDVYDFPNESLWKKKILEKNVLYANNIGSTSNAMAAELKKQVPMVECNIYITPFGVDISKFKKNNIAKKDNNIYIGNVKALEEKYGINYAILAIKKLKEEFTKNGREELANSIKMKIYGDGKEKENLQKLINDNNLQNSVYLMGRIPNNEVPNVLNELDVFCATSIFNSESFGVAVVEAMACELPVVATDVDGFCEVMENEKTGYIVKTRNVEDIACGLKKLILDEEKRKVMGCEGRKRVESLYDLKKNVQYMKEIYEKIADEDRR